MNGIASYKTLARLVSFAQIVLLAAIFGFFYAYASSAMWGLDIVDARVAIEAMNGINTAVRNPIFAPAFFGPIPVGGFAVWILWRAQARTPALCFGLSLAIYLIGAFLLTIAVSVPSNRELLASPIPSNSQEAIVIWRNYSETWQFWNWIRTVFSGLAFLSATIGIYTLGKLNHET